ncbi:hypothetical protein N0V93_006454 [Gnomoniopsis smithogilvyi]|uniref:Uncharacterized protein n=1 Tax=Gnomoniopsis smithogilvyi TaxID=1191159 RepID=A0A9W8YN89_9PEZI|nr:hypothetical protein N0V93_006454 [Gnomoniopsis smithogilvyi]
MNARAFTLAGRAIRPSTRCLVVPRPLQRRFASSEQQPSHLAQFYKTFTRPVAKVLLMAFFTYQLAYWAWVKLEADEIMAEREAYIAQLEDEIAFYNLPENKGELVRPRPVTEDRLRDMQMQLMLLEKRNAEVLAARAQAEKDGLKGHETSGQKKTAPWWKVW